DQLLQRREHRRHLGLERGDQIAIDMHDGEELVLVDGRSPDRARGLERVDRAIIVEVHQRRAECLADLIAAMTVHALDEQLGGRARRMMRDDVVPVGQSSPAWASAKFIHRSAKSVRFLVRPSVLGIVTQRSGSYWARLERSCTAWIGRKAGTEYRFESILLNDRVRPHVCIGYARAFSIGI